MPTAMHEIYIRIYQLFKDGKKQQAEELFNELLPVLSFSNQHLDISIHFFKRLLYQQGIYPTSIVRQPSLIFDEIHRSLCEIHINRVLELTNKIKSQESGG
jgi:4-hydroxy-tetrahydrodipicolinate synthase